MFLTRKDRIFNSLRFKLSAWFSGIITIVFILVFGLVQLYVRNNLQNISDSALFDKVKRLLWLGYPRHDSPVDMKDVRETFEFISTKEGSEDVFYIYMDSAYNTLAHSSLEYWKGLDLNKETIPFLPDRPGKILEKEFLSEKATRENKTLLLPLDHEYRSHTILQTRKVDGREDRIRIAFQYFNNNRLFITGLSLDSNREILSILTRLMIVSYVILIAIVILIGTILSGKALKGVNNVKNTALQIGKNRLNFRVPHENESTEIKELAEAFNGMLDRIEQLMKEQKAMTQNIAHDLRSPITSIRGITETTLSSNPGLKEYEHMAGKIIENCDRLVHLINCMLDISDIESGNYAPDVYDVDLQSVLKECFDVYSIIAEEKDISFHLNIPKILPGISGNRELLQRAFGNIVDNAIKYTPDGGKVSIKGEAKNGMIVVQIKDNGSGIPEKEHTRIYERFYRVDKSRTVTGNGLGLSLAKAYIEVHKGNIYLESQEGKGSTFSIYLPL